LIGYTSHKVTSLETAVVAASASTARIITSATTIVVVEPYKENQRDNYNPQQSIVISEKSS